MKTLAEILIILVMLAIATALGMRALDTVAASTPRYTNCRGELIVPCTTDSDCMAKNPDIDFSLECK